ncbi:autotransporter-associated beta strand repeat-containing protein, partial [Prosthecobacter sp.]|uniref:beta strand repeat-containing protein n=1 Tax=Prosthecobacter sp. TaxID=1965333 RepID=UPI003782ED91
MKTLRKHRQLLGWFMACLMVCYLPGPVLGATLTWDSTGNATVGTDGDGTWDLTNTNWADDGVANFIWNNLTPDDAIFGSGGTGGVITLGANITVGTLTFNSVAATTYTISPTAAETLTINGGITANESALITANTILGGAQSWTVAMGKTLTVGGGVTNGANLLTINGAGNTVISGIIGAGAGGITQSGAGTLTVSGVNTYSGTTTVSSGILRATTSASALGTGALSLGGGDLQLADDTGLNFARNTTLTGTATVTSDRLTTGAGVTQALGTLATGANTLNLLAGANVTSGTAGITFGNTTIASGAVFDTGANTLLTLGALQTAGNFTKQGSGILSLNTAANAARASGTVTLSAGTLNVGAASALGTTGVSLALNGGSLSLNTDATVNAHAVTVGGNTTITSNRATAGAGITHTLGTLSIGANTLSVTRGANATSGTGGVTVGAVTMTATPTFDVQTNALLTTGVIGGVGFGINKTGAGQLTTNQANTFDGAVTISGGIYSTNNLASGGGNSGVGSSASAVGNLILDGGTLQYTGAVVTSNRIFTLTQNGGGIDASGSAALTLSDATAMGFAGTGARTLTLTGANTGNNALLAIIGDGTGGATSIAKSGAGLWVLGGANTFTGGVSVSGGNLRVSKEALNAGVTNAITLSGGSLDLRDDGSGFGNRQDIVFGDNVTVTGNTTISVDRTGLAGFPGSTALNKTLQLGALNIGTNTLTANNLNGYGLEFTGTTTLSGAPSTFIVLNPTTANTSNIVAGLEFGGQVTGTGAINVGTGGGTAADGGIGGTVLLSNGTNDFIGNMTVVRGVLAATSDGALGNTANDINLSAAGAGAVATFRAAGNINLDAGRVISFNNTTATNNVIEVVQGSTLTLNSAFGGTANGFVKADNGLMDIAVSNPGFVGAVTVNAGTLQLSNATALGTTAAISVPGVFGAAVNLNGVSVSNPITLNSSTTVNVALGGVNFGGQLRGAAGTSTTTGVLRMDADAAVGVATGATLNINGGINNTTITGRALLFNTEGTGIINLNSNMTAATTTANEYFSFLKYGTGTLNITTANTFKPTNNITLFQGTTSLNGAGTLAVGNTIAMTVNPSATLTLDNSVTQVNNRLGSRPITLSGGNLNLIGGATNVTETIGAPTFARGQSTITVTAGAGQANLVFGALANNPSTNINANPAPSGATALFRGTSLGTAAGAGIATIASTGTGFAFAGQAGAVGTTNKGIIPWALVDSTVSGLGTSFATADSATGILRPLVVGTEMVTGSVTVDTNVRLLTAPAAIDARRINSLTLESGGGVTMKPLDVLTIQSGGILTRPGNTGISGGVLAYPAGGAPLIIHTVGLASDNTTMTSLLQGGNGQGSGNIAFIKAGDGILTLQPSASVIPGVNGNIAGGQTVINQGTLRLNGGNNTLYFNNYLSLVGGTLDLNGTAQTSRLFDAGSTFNGGGTITGGAGSTFVHNLDAFDRNFSGIITGSAAFQRTGPNTYTLFSNSNTTGDILIAGGATVMRDSSRFSGTTNLGINYSTLTLNNNVGTINENDRINDAAAVNLRGGVLNYIGRAQMATSETFGALNVVQAGSTINAQHGNVGVSSSLLTFGSLNRTAGSGATINFGKFIGSDIGTLGAIGSNPNVLFTAAPTLTNGIIGTWAIANYGDYASYIPDLGIGAMGQAGYTPYSAGLASGNNLPNNISNTTADVAIAANTTIGALRLGTNATRNITFTNGTASGGTDVLNLAMGGLLRSNDNNSTNIGTATNRGRLTTGGTASSGNTELLVWGNQNTMVINSVIVDTMTAIGSGTATTSLTKSGGFTLSLSGANTYTGGTIVSQGTLRLDAVAGNTIVIPAATVPADGLVINGGTVTMNQFGGQIAASNIVTLNGPGVLNLAGANTLAGLVFNNNGGGSTNPTVNTTSGGSVLNGGAALGGTLTLNGGVTVTSSNPGSIATIAGRVDLGASSRNFNVAQTIWNGQNVSDLQPALNITAALLGTAGLTKTGAGVLGFNAQNPYTGNTTVSAGTIAITANPTGAFAGARNSQLDLASGTFLNLNGANALFGSLTGSGVVTNASSTAGALLVGYDNTNSSFAGSFARFSAAAP